MTPPPLFSVIIPHWNGIRFLTDCLGALQAQTYPAIEVIVVDNASSDGSQAFIKADYPWVSLIELPTNTGFTGACNTGMRAATGEVVCLLNNDTEVAPTWAAEVMDAFVRHPEAGSVASKMLLFDRRDHIHTTGDTFSVDGRAGNRGIWEQDTGQYDREEFVFSACGGSSAYRRTLLDAVGLLDDDFFFLMEDVDLGWRAQLAGWRCLYTPKAVVYHHLSATGGGVTASYYAGRNTLLLLGKVIPADLWRKHGGKIIRAQLADAWAALKAWRGEAARARLRGIAAGLWGIVRGWGKRRAVQRTRTVSLDYLESILSPPRG
ncbi:MAG: glycosyltransferase family 2 protein [Anaerolineae bacterium]|nr:glycosyltransferase family 2 protein [Anaerolineae bacterium]